jgi:predicted PurR-regulated permease PerM
MDIYSKQMDSKLNELSTWYETNVPEDLRKFLGDQKFKDLGSDVSGFAGRLIKSTTSWFKSIVELILIPVLAFYFVLDSRSLKREFIALMPQSRMRDAMRISREVSLILQNYVIGQIILCVIAAVVTGVTLSLLGVKYALVLAIFAGITRAIPIVGPVVSGIPICILGALQSMTIGVTLLVIVVIMHFVESKFIMPILIGERMKLHPAVILIVLLIGAELFGVLGMFLAAPVAAIIRELIYFYVIRPRKNGGKQIIKEASPELVGSESVS